MLEIWIKETALPNDASRVEVTFGKQSVVANSLGDGEDIAFGLAKLLLDHANIVANVFTHIDVSGV